MKIERPALDAFGGLDALAAAVASYADLMDAHRFSVGEPAPIGHPVVDAIWHNGGMAALEVVEPKAEAGGMPRSVSALDFRRRFTPAERAAITLAASRGLEKSDATLQLWLDDLNSAGAIGLDSAEVAADLRGLVALGLLGPDRVAEILT